MVLAAAVGAPEPKLFGSVHVFQKWGTAWYEEAELLPIEYGPNATGNFGTHVAVYDGTVFSTVGLDDSPPFGVYTGGIGFYDRITPRKKPIRQLGK